jgi:uncharacterized protein YqeY
MADSATKTALTNAMKDAMRSKNKERLGVIRMALAAFKQVEVDERIEVDEARSIILLDKMMKQRKDSFQQYTDANREDLANIEAFEMTVIQEFLPVALSEAEIDALIKDAISKTGASEMKDMGKVMGMLKPQVQGKVDMGEVGAKIKAALGS